MTNIGRYKITGQPVFITAESHRRMPYLRNPVGQVAPQALPDLRSYLVWNYTKMARFLDDKTGCFDGQDETANRRISNIEPQNFEGWCRCALSF